MTQLEQQTELVRGDDVRLLVDQFAKNREYAIANASSLGLDVQYLREQNQVIVGPFISPAPLPTTYVGEPMNMRYSMGVMQTLSRQLEAKRFIPIASPLVLLGISEMPTKGAEANNALVMPKNYTTDQRVSLLSRPEKGTAYQSVCISLDDIEQAVKVLRDSFPQFMNRFPFLRRGKGALGKPILDAITEDLQIAFMQTFQESTIADDPSQSPAVNYLEFAQRLNIRILQRLYPGFEDTQTIIDSTMYDDFMRKGISDITTFTRRFKEIGTFEEDAGFVKIVGTDGKTRILNLLSIEDGDLTLQFRDDQSTITYTQLLQSPNKIGLCKNISYILCFSNILPVIYGDDNWGTFYQPYVDAKKRVRQLGFSPTMYKIQPEIPNGYQDAATVFNFYGKILNLL